MHKQFLKGLHHGIPIGLGYLSVSFGFGILAIKSGLSVLTAAIISASNLTSAGQVAGVSVIAGGGPFIEMAITQLVINIRYSLMAISLSQKLDTSFTLPHRLLAAYGITDEIFAVSAAQPFSITPAYMYGMTAISAFGWVLGTVLGAAAGEFLPSMITNAMGLVLYGMFLAIIIPPARKHRGVLAVIIIAAAVSMIFEYLITIISDGFAIIISAIAAAAIGAILFPVKEEEKQ